MGVDFEELATVDTVDTNKIKDIADLANKQMDLEDYIESLGEKVKAANDELKQIQTKDLPDAMIEAGMEEFKLNTGQKITIKEVVGASITAANKEDCFQWLEDNNSDSIIKNDVSLQFGKGEEKEATKLLELLQSEGYEPKNKRAVHSQTLLAWVREQLKEYEEKGLDFPKELFGVFEGKKAIIKN